MFVLFYILSGIFFACLTDYMCTQDENSRSEVKQAHVLPKWFYLICCGIGYYAAIFPLIILFCCSEFMGVIIEKIVMSIIRFFEWFFEPFWSHDLLEKDQTQYEQRWCLMVVLAEAIPQLRVNRLKGQRGKFSSFYTKGI